MPTTKKSPPKNPGKNSQFASCHGTASTVTVVVVVFVTVVVVEIVVVVAVVVVGTQ